MQNVNKNLLFSIVSLIIFIIISMVYNAPVISGDVAISQPDIVNYKGSAQEMVEYRNATGEETYWSDAMFGGMPTYQTGAQYDHHYIKKIDEVFRFLPRPADYMFLMFAGFFLLGMVLFKNWKYAFLGACLFAMGTYFFQLYEAGHNSKVHAIAYFAPLTAGIILLYREKYIIGFLLTSFFMALELVANHPQMTYYLGLALIIYVLVELYDKIKKNDIKTFAISSALALFAVILGIGMNATSIMATYEYGAQSTRGENDVTLFENANESGLDKDYITQWSYGQLETLNLLIPNLMGGGSIAAPDTKENLKKSIERNAQSPEEYQYFSQAIDMIPTYWGNQPFTSGPAYQGAVVILLFMLGLFLVKGKFKIWLGLATLLSILLAWGKNMMWFTDIFIDYVPLYDKFRAVSSILVIAEFTMPLLAVLAVYQFFKDKSLNITYKKKVLLYAGGGVVAFLLTLYIAGEGLFGFKSEFDQQLPMYMQKGIVADRVAMFKSDLIRSLIFVILALGLLMAYVWDKLKQREIVLAGLAVLTLIDLWGVDKRYLNKDNFISKRYVDYPFPTELTDRLYADAQSNPTIMQIAAKVPTNQVLAEIKNRDQGHYRVFNAATSTFNDASTSYFVSSVGGYHGAKLQNFQNVIDVYFARDSVLQKRLNVVGGEQQVLDMLNTKYFVVNAEDGPSVMPNPSALGNAWFVNHIKKVKNANEAIVQIGKIDTKNEAVVMDDLSDPVSNQNASIELISYAPNQLEFTSTNPNDGFAVFSEIYYNKGWVATIDGKPAEIIQTNYFLRGLEIPAGEHTIVFEFKPKVVETGGVLSLSSHIIFILFMLGGVYAMIQKRKNTLDNAR
ncbi:YfhO family protein [Flavobacteriaceae bacterium Ap0902]|nr:YfhO family protein [Flavobacteriaceae bacterium Ap0902]